MNCFGKYAKAGSVGFADLPNGAPYSKPGLPMLRIAFLGIAPYPKPFKQTRGVCLAFLILVSLHKRACDAALNEKSLSLCDRLCSQNRSEFG